MSRSSDASGGSFLQLGTALAYQTPGSSSDALEGGVSRNREIHHLMLWLVVSRSREIHRNTRACITRLLLRYLLSLYLSLTAIFI